MKENENVRGDLLMGNYKNDYGNLLNDIRTKQIVIFGCGEYFRRFCFIYDDLIEKIAFIIDNDKNKQNTTIFVDGTDKKYAIPIYSVDFYLMESTEEYILVICSKDWESIQKQVQEKLGARDWFYHMPLSYENHIYREKAIIERMVVPSLEMIEKYDLISECKELFNVETKQEYSLLLRDGKKRSIARMPLIMTPRCTLRCKDCGNLMWAFKNAKDIEPDIIIESVKKILATVDVIVCVELIGGEAFLSQGVEGILKYLISEKRILTIEITTNATTHPKKTVLGLLKSPKVHVLISDYSMVINQTSFMEILDKNDIKYKILSMAWRTAGGMERRDRNDKELINQYYKCGDAIYCKALWGDKLYPCTRVASLANLNINDEFPYLLIDDRESLWSEIKGFFAEAITDYCNYCDLYTEDEHPVDAAIQM